MSGGGANGCAHLAQHSIRCRQEKQDQAAERPDWRIRESNHMITPFRRVITRTRTVTIPPWRAPVGRARIATEHEHPTPVVRRRRGAESAGNPGLEHHRQDSFPAILLDTGSGRRVPCQGYPRRRRSGVRDERNTGSSRQTAMPSAAEPSGRLRPRTSASPATPALRTPDRSRSPEPPSWLRRTSPGVHGTSRRAASSQATWAPESPLLPPTTTRRHPVKSRVVV